MTGLPPLSNPALLTTLLAALSHELGSPLAAIKGAATTLIDYGDRLPDERIEGFLQSIDAQTDRLNDLLDDLVLFAKIQVGTLHLQPEPIALHRVLEQAIEQLPPEQRNGFSLEGGDLEVMADLPYLRHALALLLQHLHESPKTPRLIRLGATTCAQLWIMGAIDPEWGDPFTPIDQLIASNDSDRGRRAASLLRIALSRALIELHGGAWKVESRSGAELALCVTLPLADLS